MAAKTSPTSAVDAVVITGKPTLIACPSCARQSKRALEEALFGAVVVIAVEFSDVVGCFEGVHGGRGLASRSD